MCITLLPDHYRSDITLKLYLELANFIFELNDDRLLIELFIFQTINCVRLLIGASFEFYLSPMCIFYMFVCVLYCTYVIFIAFYILCTYYISPLDRNFVLAKICVFVKIYVYNTDTYAFVIQYNVLLHIHPIMHIPSYHHATLHSTSPFFFSARSTSGVIDAWLVSASCLFPPTIRI